MNQPYGTGGQTVMQELNQTSSLGLALFPDSTRMGLWEMGRSQSAASPYTELVSLGPLPADYGVISRRSQLREINQTLTAGHGVLALHDAILAAYKYMTQTYAPNYSNAVLVLTSGVDSAPGDMQLSRLLTQLRSLHNASRKVELVILMFGQGGDFNAIQQIAGATNGVAFQITNPAEVGKVFFEAVAQRMCDQGCTLP
jgi:hypothetical protein